MLNTKIFEDKKANIDYEYNKINPTVQRIKVIIKVGFNV